MLPNDLNIVIPSAPSIPIEDKHYLAYIPWDEDYMRHIPEKYRDFFSFILPCLHTRTSDVHTALSAAQLPYLLKDVSEPVDERAISLALLLHDCGWSQVDQQGLVTSLSYNSVTPAGSHSIRPKQQHLIYGTALAYRLLDAYDFGSEELTTTDIYEIAGIIRRHDHDAAWEQGKYGTISTEIKIVCDADRLWSYTYENFWLDIVRKGVAPETYVRTIADEISDYFFTDQGKTRARQLAAERKAEVDAYLTVMADKQKLAHLLDNASRPSMQLMEKARRLTVYLKSRRLQHLPLKREAY